MLEMRNELAHVDHCTVCSSGHVFTRLWIVWRRSVWVKVFTVRQGTHRQHTPSLFLLPSSDQTLSGRSWSDAGQRTGGNSCSKKVHPGSLWILWSNCKRVLAITAGIINSWKCFSMESNDSKLQWDLETKFALQIVLYKLWLLFCPVDDYVNFLDWGVIIHCPVAG